MLMQTASQKPEGTGKGAVCAPELGDLGSPHEQSLGLNPVRWHRRKAALSWICQGQGFARAEDLLSKKIRNVWEV